MGSIRYILIFLGMACGNIVCGQENNKLVAKESIIIPTIDVSHEEKRQSVIAAGTEEVYQGHPTTLLLPDGETVYCVWSIGHGGSCGPMAKSEDGGESWKMVQSPGDWTMMKNCPSLYWLKDKGGVERMMIFASNPEMARTYSMDGGEMWSPVESLGISAVMPFTSIIRLKNGNHLGVYNRRPEGVDGPPQNEVWQSISHDGGMSWENPTPLVQLEDRIPCEPELIRSPDGEQILCVMRDNKRGDHSLMITSNDEGKTWSEITQTPWGLTGDRHKHQYTKDGRLVVAFRDKAPNSPTYNHFVIWVGIYEDIVQGNPGQYRVKLLHSYKGGDCGYPGLELLPNGSFLATTYIKYRPGKEKNSVVSVKFKLSEFDKYIKNN